MDKTKQFKIRCYKRNGDLDHEEFASSLKEAQERRKNWGKFIGLPPEPTTFAFAYYPTIWKWKLREYADGTTDYGYERLEGY